MLQIAWSLRLSRFVLIGFGSTALYALLAFALSRIQELGVTAASVLAFGIAALFSYAGHKYVTFVSGGSHSFELPRFLVLSGVGLAVVAILPALLSDCFGLPAAIPILLACLAIPAINFVMLDRWVFVAGARG